jgi:hypothetical protein
MLASREDNFSSVLLTPAHYPCRKTRADLSRISTLLMHTEQILRALELSLLMKRKRISMNRTIDLTGLTLHPVPAALTHSHGRVRDALTTLEATLVACKQDRVLLLLENKIMEDLSIIAIERFLRYTQCQRVLLLVNPKLKTKIIEAWKQAVSWEDGRKLSEQFSVTSIPQNAEGAQVCIASVFDIQAHIGIDSTRPFFNAFDALVLYDVPNNPGPAWSQIVEIFATMDIPVIGLSSRLSEEEGELFFERVIDAKGHQVRS